MSDMQRPSLPERWEQQVARGRQPPADPGTVVDRPSDRQGVDRQFGPGAGAAGDRAALVDAGQGAGGAPGERSPIAVVLAALRRGRLWLIPWVVGWFALACAAIFSLEPRYRASALVMLDSRELNLGAGGSVLTNPTVSMDANIARGEVEVLGSESLARRVVADMGLVDSPSFAPKPSTVARLKAALVGGLDWVETRTGLPVAGLVRVPEAAPETPTETARLAGVVDAYRRNLSVYNDGRSYVITVGVQSTDPDLAARIVNRHVELYTETQLRMKNEALVSAGALLEREVETLAERLRESERTVQSFREKKGLLSPRGVPVSAQQLADVNNQLALARADVAQREAKMRSVQSAMARGGGDSESEVTSSPTIARLREQEATARQREADLAASLSAEHPRLLAARSGVREIQRKIAEEVQKAARGLASDAGIAREREAQLQRSVTQLEQRMTETDRAEAEARDLERVATATRSLYETLLTRHKQLATQQGSQRADARLVSPAASPNRPSFPNTPLFLVVALMASAGSGVGLALLRDRLRPLVSSLEEAVSVTGLRGLGVLPHAPRRSPMHRRVIVRPKSVAAEAIRALRGMLILSGSAPKRPAGPRVLAVTSSMPGEGKSTVAVSLARSMAGSGLNVLLIDADLRRPMVARLIWKRPKAERGLADALSGDLALEAVVQPDEISPLRVLPAGTPPGAAAPQDLLGSARMSALLGVALETYDCVVIDTPPIGVVTDAAVVASLSDAVVMVARWQKTPVPALRASVASLRAAKAPLAGVLVNDANPRRLPAYSDGAHYVTRGHHSYFET